MNKTSLLCLFGGRSSEYEVSLISAHSILSNIDREKYDITTVGITKNGDWYHYAGDIAAIKDGSWCNDTATLNKAVLSPSVSDSCLLLFPADGTQVQRIHIDVIFPIMHGANAEDGTLQGLLKLSGIPFVGCGCTTSAIGMDKGYTKLVLNNFGIPQAKCKIILRNDFNTHKTEVLDACETLGEYPLFVKPANAGSSVGASKADSRAELESAITLAAEHDSKIIVEEYINGKEIEVAVIGNNDYVASTCGQINPGSEFYDYDAKYSADSNSSCLIPADIKWETMLDVRTYAVKICSILGVSGLSRVDFFVSEDNGEEKITFNEINTLPGFTQISMYPKLMVSDGMSYSDLIDALITLALEKEGR
ncbi:MAG: D-alanine--D-alanine ligase [Clostridia bacterium]|nr:D-alanine--D-alanine ligase [Clostridia bacterium]